MRQSNQPRKTKPVVGLEKDPVNIRQTIYLIAAIVRRIEAKRLDKEAQSCFVSEAAEGVAKDEENR